MLRKASAFINPSDAEKAIRSHDANVKKEEKQRQLQAKLQVRRAEICNKAHNVLPRFDKPVIPDTPLPGAKQIDPFSRVMTPKSTGETPFKGAKRNNPLHEKKNAYKEQVDRRVEEIALELNVNLTQARVLYAQNASLRTDPGTPIMMQSPRSPGTPSTLDGFYTPAASARPIFARQDTTATMDTVRSNAFLSSPRMDHRLGFSRDAVAAMTATDNTIARTPIPPTSSKAQRTMGIPVTSPSASAVKKSAPSLTKAALVPLRIEIHPRTTFPMPGSPASSRSPRTPGTPGTPKSPLSIISANSNPRTPSGGYFDEPHPIMLDSISPRTPGSAHFDVDQVEHAERRQLGSPNFGSKTSSLNPNSPTRGILKSGPSSPSRYTSHTLQNVQARRGVLVRSHTSASVVTVDSALVQPLDYLTFKSRAEEDDGYGEYSPRSPACSTFGGSSNYTASVYSPVVRFEDGSEPGTPRASMNSHFIGRSKVSSGLGVMHTREDLGGLNVSRRSYEATNRV